MPEEWKELNQKINEATEYVQSKIGALTLEVALVAGSGMEGLVSELKVQFAIPYKDIPHMKKSGVLGHVGEIQIGLLFGVPTLISLGRLHYYEGHSMEEVTFLTRIIHRLGVATLVLTNAAGGINSSFQPGSLMLITDHLNLMNANPLRGPWQQDDGPRFPDMHDAYDANLRIQVKKIANELGIVLHEGIYAAMSGPNYETPAEVRMLKTLGADAVGMSTVPEVLVARQCNLRVLGISHIANSAAGLGGGSITHHDVLEAGRNAAAKTTQILARLFSQGFGATT